MIYHNQSIPIVTDEIKKKSRTRQSAIDDNDENTFITRRKSVEQLNVDTANEQHHVILAQSPIITKSLPILRKQYTLGSSSSLSTTKNFAAIGTRQLGSMSDSSIDTSVDSLSTDVAVSSSITPSPSSITIMEDSAGTKLLCGLAAGIVQAAVFNPYDRALYLSVKDNRPFLRIENWNRPYTGFYQTVGGRALQGGLYFPLENFFLHLTESYCPGNKQTGGTSNCQWNHFIAGMVAGAVNAVVLNPISAIKYKTWGREVNRGLVAEAIGMLQKSNHSIRPFFNGLCSTINRDIVFGGTYTSLRFFLPQIINQGNNNQQQHHEPNNNKNPQWVANLISACCATIVSGPFNYVRNVQYATKSADMAPTTIEVFRDLFYEMNHLPPNGSVLMKIKFLQTRLRIGWGTARVAMGMSLAQTVYDKLSSTAMSKSTKHQ